MSDEAVRKEFEAWAVSRHGLFAAMAPGGIATRIGDGYNKERVQILWESWQASRSLYRSAAIQECADIAESEPEFPGFLPDHIRTALLNVGLEEQQRSAVRATKKAIAARILALKER